MEESAKNNKKTNKKRKLARKKEKIVKVENNEARLKEVLVNTERKQIEEKKDKYSTVITKRKDRLEKLEQDLKILSDAIRKKREKIKQMRADNKRGTSLMLMLARDLHIAKSWWREKTLSMNLVKLRFQRERIVPGGTSSRQCSRGDHLSQESECRECDSDSTVSSVGTSYIDPYRPITQQHNMTGDEWDLEEEHMGSIEERLYTLFLSRCDSALPEDEGVISSTSCACSAIVDTCSTITVTSDTYSTITPLSDFSDEECDLKEIIEKNN